MTFACRGEEGRQDLLLDCNAAKIASCDVFELGRPSATQSRERALAAKATLDQLANIIAIAQIHVKIMEIQSRSIAICPNSPQTRARPARQQDPRCANSVAFGWQILPVDLFHMTP